MPTKTTNFTKLRELSRRCDPDWDANVGERRRAMRDALAGATASSKITQLQLRTRAHPR